MTEKKGLTGYHLKLIALITMAIDHIAAVVIWRLYVASFNTRIGMHYSPYLEDRIIIWIADNQDMIYAIYEWMRYIGRMAFPIYCFLLVEGFLHTRDVKKYAARLAIFAFISEIPFDLAVEGQWMTFACSNVFFTLVLGLLAIWALSFVEKFYQFWEEKRWEPILGRIMTLSSALIIIVGFGLFADMVLRTDYGFGGIVAIVALYLLRRQKLIAFIVSVMLLSVFAGDIEILALAMLYPIMKYDGTRGKNVKYVFYAFYPVHLFVFALICMAMGV